MPRCSNCGENIGLFSLNLTGENLCNSCQEKKKADQLAKEIELNRQEIERRMSLVEAQEQQREESRQALIQNIKNRLNEGQELYCYDAIYIPVDSVVDDTQIVNEFDISTLKLMGLDGWSIEGIVPKTIGLSLHNVSLGATSGQTYGGGMGGNVVGVHILLKKRITRIGEELSIDSLSIDGLLKAFGGEVRVPVFPIASATSVNAASATIPKTEEKISFRATFDVILVSAGDRKIPVLKTIREEMSLGLNEAKELIDNAPMLIKEGIKKEEADMLKAKLEMAGAIVEVK